MRVDLGDQPEVRLDDPTELLRHLLEPRAERALEIGERDGRRLRRSFAPPRGESVDPLAQIHEPDVHRQRPLVAGDRVRVLALRLAGRGRASRAARSWRRRLPATVSTARRSTVSATANCPLSKKAIPSASDVRSLPSGRPQRLLELGDRLVEQPHLLEGDAEVVVGLVVVGRRDSASMPRLNCSRISWNSRCSSPSCGSRRSIRIRVSRGPSSSKIREPRSTKLSASRTALGRGRAGGGRRVGGRRPPCGIAGASVRAAGAGACSASASRAAAACALPGSCSAPAGRRRGPYRWRPRARARRRVPGRPRAAERDRPSG